MPTDPGVLTTLLNNFLDVFRLGYGRIMPDARWLLQTLALIEIVFAALWWAFKREDAIVAFLQRILWVGFFIYLVTEWPTLVTAMRDSLAMVGLRAGGNALSLTDFMNPSQLAYMGIVATKPIFDHIGAWGILTNNLGDVIISGLSGLIILLAFFIMAIQVFITVLEFYLGSVLTLILVPFGVNRHTAFIAERAFGMVISFGIKLMVLGFITSATFPVLNQLTIPSDPALGQVFSMMLASLAIAFLMWHAPSIAAGLMAGSPSLSAGTVVGSTLAGGLAAAGAYRLGSQTLGQSVRYSGAIGKASVSTASAMHTAARLGAASPLRQLGDGRVGKAVGGLRGVGQLAVGASSYALRHNRIAQGFKSAVAQGRVAGVRLSGLAPDGRVDGQNGTSPAGTV